MSPDPLMPAPLPAPFAPAPRLGRIRPSASAAASARARTLQGRGADILSLTMGEPDFPTPEHVVDAAVRAMRRGETGYTNTAGTAELKAAVAAKFDRENGLRYADEEIFVGAGCKPVIFHALMATVAHGDEVLVPAPYWVSYTEMVRFAGGTPVVVETSESGGFLLDPQTLEQAITPRTRWLLLNSPCNPSGATYGPGEIEAIAAVVRRHPQMAVLTDDIYEHILFDGRQFTTIAAVAPDLRNRILTVNGVSKAYSMTGWRIGYAGGPADLIRLMTKMQSQSSGNPCSISQAAAIAALTGPQAHVGERCRIFQDRRDRIVGRINAIPGLSCRSPAGAFYVYVNVSGLIDKAAPDGRRLTTDEEVSAYFLDSVGLASVHGAAYGLSPYVRLSFAADVAKLDDATDRMRRAAGSLCA